MITFEGHTPDGHLSTHSKMGRPSLTRLVQQIGEIVAQGDDSGSQSQTSDGGLRVRLRTVLLSLLDGVVGDSAGK